jgi:TonB-linked SusC/RagA family outer membrane protein
MRRTLLVSMAAAFLACAPLAAQAGRITGTVTSADGSRPLAGAVVTVAGSAARAVTGPAGTYTLQNVAPGARSVTAATLGHAAQTRTVNVSADVVATLDFQLRPSAVAVEGLVAIGYGDQRARDRTGVVNAVTSEQFNQGRVVSPEQLITGKVAGVQVVDNNEPGGGISVRIRGGTSVNASNDPLYVVDGTPLQVGGGYSAGRNPLNFLNPNDIESVTVLKDASATAIYGSRGANGVILIRTKSGATGAPQFTYGFSGSTSQVTGGPDLVSAAQYRAAVQQYAPGNMTLIGDASTDWRGLVERDATGQEHNLTVSGAGSTANYRLSLGYLDQQGVLRGTDVRRVSGGLNYNQRLFEDRLSVRTSVKGSRSDDSFTPGGVLGEATNFAPTAPVYTTAGSYFQWNNPLGTNNPLQELALVRDKGTTYRSVGNVEAQYRLPFLSGLSATVRGGYDVSRADRTIFSPTTVQYSVESPTCVKQVVNDSPVTTCGTGTLERRNPSATGTVVDAFGNYTRTIASINTDVDLTAGWSYENQEGMYNAFVSRGLNTDLLGAGGLPTYLQTDAYVNPDDRRKLASEFARANITFHDRYLFTASVRRDASSQFSPNHQVGVFPAAAFAWRLVDEPFMRGFSGTLSDLKVRVSWGVNGNQTFTPFQYLGTFTAGDNQSQVQFGNTFVSTIRPNGYNPSLKWEETRSTNVGADYGLWDGRVSGSVDYYFKKTTDLLFDTPVPAGTNFTNHVITNIGEVHNRGLELQVGARILEGGSRGGLTWDANFNAATNRNRLVRITGNGAEQILTGGIAGGVGSNIQVLRPGSPVNAFFVYEHVRVNGKPVYADVNGDSTINEQDLYVDQNGDDVINQDDRRPFHSPAPTWILGHTSNFGYRGFDLSTTLRAYLGNYVYNNLASNLGNYSVVTGGAPGSLQASALETGFVKPQYFSDVYVEDASFVRMDNVTLGYRLRGFRGARDVRVFGTVQNAFTLTGYSGIDPTSGLNGIDNNIYPRSRTFTVGVNLGF